MQFSGIDLTLMVGASNPAPAPVELMQALRGVEVAHHDTGRSGFQVSFFAGKTIASQQGAPIVLNDLFAPFNRVIVQVNVFGVRTVLADGIITHQQLMPTAQPGAAVFAVTGEDVSVMMDLEQKVATYPGQDEQSIATQVIGQYGGYGVSPTVVAPPVAETLDPTEYLPVQRGTDLAWLRELAERFAYVFYVSPGGSPGTNIGYWGPPVVDSSPQKAISIDLGPDTNAGGASFVYDGLAPTTISGQVQDRLTDVIQSVEIDSDSGVLPALSARPAITSQRFTRHSLLEQGEGRTAIKATALAQGRVNAASGRTMRVEGQLDGVRYGAVLKVRALVDLRGGSGHYDGKYYVERVVHRFSRRSYQQDFRLTREGLGTTISTVTV